MHVRTDEEIWVKVLLRYEEFKILATQGSSDWNEERIKALARAVVRQVRDNCASSNRTTSIRVFINCCVIIWIWNSTATLFSCVD